MVAPGGTMLAVPIPSSNALQAPAPCSPFQELVGEAAWTQLPRAVRQRFGRLLAPGESAGFIGEVSATTMTNTGWLWAQIARLMGAPLPLKRLSHTPAAVLVTEDATSDMQLWTRIYHEPGRLPQVIRSMKRFAGPTGLEECVGAGVGMMLTVTVEHRCLVFRSEEYFWRAGRLRVRIPRLLTPGRIEVIHREERAGRFSFTLNVDHRWFGRIIQQVAFFRDTL
jgi:hypothetical protein